MTSEIKVPITLDNSKINEKKKRVTKKKEAVEAPIESQIEAPVKAPVEAPVAKPKPKAKPKTAKRQETPQNDGGAEMDFEKISNLIDTNPAIAEEFQNILKKHLK